MLSFSRRDFLGISLAASAGLAPAADVLTVNVHQQLLDLAAEQERQRRARFGAVKTRADLDELQNRAPNQGGGSPEIVVTIYL